MRRAWAVAVVLGLASSALGYEVKETHDDFEGTSELAEVSNIFSQHFDGSGIYALNLVVVKAKGGACSASFQTVYAGDKRVGWAEGESLQFRVGGEIVRLSSSGLSQREVRSVWSEAARYPLEGLGLPERIAAAEGVWVRLVGTEHVETAELPDRCRERFRDFIRRARVFCRGW